MEVARRPAPVVEHVQVLFVSDVLLDVRFRYTAGFRESLPTAERVANAYIFERSPQNSVGGTSTVSHLNLPSVRSSPRNTADDLAESAKCPASLKSSAQLAERVCTLHVSVSIKQR